MLNAFGLDASTIEAKFIGLKNDVQLMLFTQESDCPHCNDLKFLVEKLASITSKIKVEKYNFAINAGMDDIYNIKRIPALVLNSGVDYGIRYYCAPTGPELYNFLDDIVLVSRREEMLDGEKKRRLNTLTKQVSLEYFTSPECPFSWPGERTLVKLAMACENVSLDIIDVTEFRQVAEQYNVRGIPMTVINGKKNVYGALTEDDFIEAILENA